MNELVSEPGLVVGGKLLALIVVYFVGLNVATLWHELGHALAALVLTKQRIILRVGRSETFSMDLGRLRFVCGLVGLRNGFTQYERATESRRVQTWVALAGPAMTLYACAAFAIFAIVATAGSWIWVVWLGLFVANFRILIVSCWPIAYRPDGSEGEEWLSDALDIIRMWRG